MSDNDLDEEETELDEESLDEPDIEDEDELEDDDLEDDDVVAVDDEAEERLESLIANGKKLFAQKCQRCHGESHNAPLRMMTASTAAHARGCQASRRGSSATASISTNASGMASALTSTSVLAGRASPSASPPKPKRQPG